MHCVGGIIGALATGVLADATINPAGMVHSIMTQAKGVTVIWTIPPGPKPEDFLPDVAPPAGTPWVIAPVDKFFKTDLEQQLKDKGITTVVLAGTSAYGAVMFTASAAAIRGFDVVIPVDGMSAQPAYGEQSTAWIIANLPGSANKVTMTRGDMIAYQ